MDIVKFKVCCFGLTLDSTVHIQAADQSRDKT